MQKDNLPQISVIIITPDNYQTIANTMSYLQKQTIKSQIELIILVSQESNLLAPEEELKGFYQVKIIEIGLINWIAKIKEIGVKVASASIVAFIEDHTYPSTNWAEAFVKAHKDEWAAVGPVAINPNPNTLVSWANFYIEYGFWADPRNSEEVELLPGNNGSYKKDILLSYKDKLAEMLDSETVLHWDLCAKGYKLYLTSEAKIHHINITRVISYLQITFHAGRLFANSRSLSWDYWRKIAYFFGSPLIPLVRLRRILAEIQKTRRSKQLIPAVLPWLMVGLIFSALGEMVGYVFGYGSAKERIYQMEFHRERLLAKGDRIIIN